MHNNKDLLRFQSLPLDIIHAIIGFLPKDKDYVCDAKYTLALLQCCHRWRNVYIKKSFRSLKFNFLQSETPRLVFCDCPVFIQPVDYMHIAPVKSVVTKFAMWNSLRHGDFDSAMSKAGFSVLTFPSVHSIEATIILNLGAYRKYTTDREYIVQDTLSYLRLIDRMFPAVTDFTLQRFQTDSLAEMALHKPVISQTLDMMSRATSVSFGLLISTTLSVDGTAARFSELTSFTFKFSSGTLWSADVIRQNARTLVNIKLVDIPLDYTDSFLYRGDGIVVVYPALQSIRFINYSSPSSGSLNNRISSSANLAHFPNLKIFVTDTVYPFNIDSIPVLPTTMEYLCICLPNSPDELAKFWPFPFESFPHLRRLSVRHHKYSTQCKESFVGQRDALFCQIIKSVFRSANLLDNLELAYPISKAAFFDHILLTGSLANICKLHIPNVKLAFADIVTLLQSAQRLQCLACNPDSQSLTLPGVDYEQLSEYVLANLFPLSKDFQKLVIGYNSFISQNNFDQFISLLAIMCPNFTQLDFKHNYPRCTLMLIERICKSDIFKEYAHILRHFILCLKAQARARGY